MLSCSHNTGGWGSGHAIVKNVLSDKLVNWSVLPGDLVHMCGIPDLTVTRLVFVGRWTWDNPLSLNLESCMTHNNSVDRCIPII